MNIYLPQEEIEQLVLKYTEYRDKANNSPEDMKTYQTYQNYCMDKLKFLVEIRSCKYKKFNNYEDLQQAGFEALLLALNSYDKNKSCFGYWCDRYISTKISRQANTHFVVRIPIKRAKALNPRSVSEIPSIIDEAKNPEEIIESKERSAILHKQINKLKPLQQQAIKLAFGIDSTLLPIKEAAKQLNLPRNQYVKILNEAKKQLKELNI